MRPHHSGTPSKVLASQQENLSGMLMLVDHHSEVRTQVESKERSVAETKSSILEHQIGI